MGALQRRIYEVLTDPPEGDRLGHAWTVFILTLITTNVLATILETVPSLGGPHARFFHGFELFSVLVFSVEYALRLWTCTSDPATSHPVRGRLAVARRFMPMVDLLAILPFYLQLLLPGLDLRFVRALRLFRIFRVFRAGQLAEAVGIVAAVVRNRRNELLATFLVIVIVVVLAGNVMYLLEHHAQPDRFSSVPAAMWWAVITVTTIGYGDLFPVTAAGRLVGSVLAVVGIVMLALPVGVLGAGFLEEIERRRKAASASATAGAVCPHCGRPCD